MPLASQVLGIGGVKSIQRGLASITTVGGTTLPITPVDPAFTELRMLGGTEGMFGANTAPLGYIALSGGGSSITFKTSGSPTYPAVISWELTEYYPS